MLADWPGARYVLDVWHRRLLERPATPVTESDERDASVACRGEARRERDEPEVHPCQKKYLPEGTPKYSADLRISGWKEVRHGCGLGYGARFVRGLNDSEAAPG